MRSTVIRLILLGAVFALAGCGNVGNGGALPFAGPPNNAGGAGGTFQPGGNSTALLRFVQGSPDFNGVDVCVDNEPFGLAGVSVNYGTAAAEFAITGGIPHSISVYPPAGAFGGPGVECATAPGPYFGTSAIAVTIIRPGTFGNPLRETIVLGGTAASNTLGLYVFGDSSFAVTPTGDEAISHNAAPAFSATTPNQSVGFGFTPVAGSPTTLAGAGSVAAPTRAGVTSAAINANVISPLAAVPTSFFDGVGVTSGNVVPITTVAAPAQVLQPYVVQLYAIDAAGGGLGLVPVLEQSFGHGFR